MVPEKQYLFPSETQEYLHRIFTYLLVMLPLLSAQAQTSSTIEQQLLQAEALLDSANYDAAINLILPLKAAILQADSGLARQCRYLNLLGNCYLDKRDYEQAFTQFTQAQNLIRAKGDTTTLVYAQALNTLSNYNFKIGSFGQSLPQAEQALAIRLQHLGRKHPETADSYNNIANCYLVSGRYEEALGVYQEVLTIRQEYWQGSHPDIASVLNNMGNTFLRMGAPQGATEYYRQALNMRKALLGPTHINTIDGYQNLGNAYFAAQQLDSALFYTQLSLTSLQEHYPDQQIRIANLYSNLGNISTEKRQFSQAQAYLNEALAIQKRLLNEDNLSIADTYQNKGDAFYENTDYKQALLYYRRANGIYRQQLGGRHPQVASVWDKIGLSLQYLGDFSLAEDAHFRALSIREEFFGAHHIFVAGTNLNIGNCHWKNKHYQPALDFYEKALAILQKVPDIPPIEYNQLYNNIGNCYYEMRELRTALSYYEKALEFLPNGNPLPKINYYKHLGLVYNQELQFEAAAQAFDDGLALLEAYPVGIAPIEALQLLDASASNLLDYYQSNQDQQILKLAHETYQKAIALLDQLWQGYLSAESRQKLNETHFRIFEGAIESCFELWQLNDALSYLENAFLLSEKSKSSRLLHAVRTNQSAYLANIPADFANQLQQLGGQIAFYEKNRHDLLHQSFVDHQRLLTIDSLIFQLKTQRDSLHNSLQEKFPAYRNLMSDQNLETIASTQKKLEESTQQLLSFFAGEENIYAFAISTSSIQLTQIPLDFPLESWLVQLGNSIVLYPFAGSQEAHQLDSLYVTYANGLYEKIWAPLQLTKNQKLTIIPDGLLSYLPFEVLLSEIPEQAQRYRSYPFLLKDCNISYAYSATLLAEAQARPKSRAPKKWLGVAPSFENSQLHLNPLDFNQAEVRTIQQLIGGDIIIGQEATRERFLELASDYRWLHLATHAVSSRDFLQNPFLAFAQTGDSTNNEQLFAADLFHQNFPAELVVLSACETGFGNLQRSEGIASLARSFTYAGAKSVITTLWSINDAQTALFMENFYKRLKKGQSKDAALWETKTNFVSSSTHEYAHPFYWAAYLPIGDMSKMGTTNILFFGKIGLLIIVLAIAIFFFKRYFLNPSSRP